MDLVNYHGGRNGRVLLKGEGEFDAAYSDCCQYGKVSFWDERYLDDSEPFEWYYPYQYFRNIIIDKLPVDLRIMIAGCGSSNMLEDMAADGFEQLVGVDFSRVVLNQMAVRCEDLPQVSFHLGTLDDLDYPNGHFQAIIDKALFDSMSCSEEGQLKITSYINEVERILTNTGVFMVISNLNPDEMLQYLEQYDIEEPNYSPWYIEVQAVEKPAEFEGEDLNPDNPDNLYFMYIATKQEDLVEKKKQSLKKKKDQRQDPRRRHKANRI